MAGEGELELEVEFPKFLADILDKTEIIFENFAEAHAEVLLRIPLRKKAKKDEIREDHFLKFLLRCSRNFED